KCNRQFPCNHCLRRGVAHLCRFMTKPAASKANKSNPSVDDGPSRRRKRNLDAIEDASPLEGSDHLDAETPSFDASSALSALGYMPHTHHTVLGRGSGPMDEDKEPSEELKNAIKMVHPKPYTDCLVDNWLGGANYHYCALYPPEFRTQYDGWWTVRTDNPSPELTSLILRVCACSLLFIIDGSVKERLESELRADSLTLATRLHEAAEALGASIPHGKGGLVHVQQLFLTAFWYKSAEKWTEAWHALSSAIGAAYEIGLHQDSSSEGMSEFDREMRRRLWCVLYLWDFALSSMLSRPMLINRADCTFEMPTLALEVNPGQPYQPSPFRHMKLHCQMCIDMAEEMASVPSDKAATDLAPRLRGVVDRWFANLPAEYAVKDPDTRWDAEYDWVVFQRRYLHLVGYMFLSGPLKPYVTRSSAKPMTEEETQLRAAGVQAALALMDVSWSFFENLASFGAKFHYAVFCIFDTTTVLCSAFVHDEARTLPQRETALAAIKRGLGMLEELRSVSKTTSDLCRILKSLLMNLPLSPKEKALIGISKRTKSRHKPSPASDAAG
ncbi:fungal-specific transcription factor domain-containing protein, partial [Immersiella caudata]